MTARSVSSPAKVEPHPEPKAGGPAMGAGLRAFLTDNLPLVIAALLLAAAARLMAWRFGIVDDRLPGLVSLRDGLRGGLGMVGLAGLALAYLALAMNPLRRRLRARQGDDGPIHLPVQIARRLGGILTVYVAIAFFMDGFVAFKRAIPLIHPFAWDQTFYNLDRLLHFGVDPWRLTHGLAGSPLAAAFLDWSYAGWFIVVPLCTTWAAWSLDREWRLRFFGTYVMLWVVLGIILATWLSSAGPCFFGRLLGDPDPYAPLMGTLRDMGQRVDLTSLAIQDELWRNHELDRRSLVKGISAMPSLHVAVCVLFALAYRQLNRWVGWALAVYATLVMLATVHLGWHYAIDGYLAALLTWVIWRLAGPVSRAYFASRTIGGQRDARPVP